MSSEHEASFGERLRRLREAAGLTQEELAGRAGLSPNAVGDLERGRRRHPYPHTVRSLADALKLAENERAALIGSVPRRGGTGTLAPPAAVAPAVGLPEPPSPLIGRERDAARLGAILRRGEARLVTLTGPGGVGKTRLGLEVARDAAGDYPDGAFFVGLASLDDPDLVVPTVSQVLGLRETGERPSRETLLAYLDRRKLLLVLDNFEHLLGAAPEIAGLLVSSPGLAVLATSRAPLRVRGEHEYPVGPLAVPDPSRTTDAESVAASPSAEFFARRAREANPRFSLTRKNAPAVAAICWRLDGLPLALELAAARARFLGPTELLARLDPALEAGGARDLPERQRTMRATLDWSHGLLSEEEKATFGALSVFAGGFTLEAAEFVGKGTGAVTDLLGSLVEQSLVAADTDDGEGAQYRMLEPVRQYALEKLEEGGEAEQIRGWHAEYYLALAEQARAELHRPRQAEWLDVLSREHDNLRAAMAWLLGRGRPGKVTRIGWGIHEFWFRRGYTGEGLRWMERALAEGDALPHLARARALWVISVLSFVRNRLDRAAAIAAEGVAAARAAGDTETLAYALAMQGLAAVSRGDLDPAGAALPEAQALFRELGDPHGVSSGLYGLANLALARGDRDEARRLISEAEDVAREAGSWAMLASCLDTQAMSARLGDDDARTAELLRESIGLAGLLRDDFNAVFCATGLAGVAAREGRAERAVRLFGAADGLSEKTGAGVSWSVWRTLNERDLTTARAMLDPEAFEKAWAEGRTMTLEETVAEAFAEGS